ncbi:ethylbenzene dehydrogenase-related protein [Haladaptatus sp. NG-SE-30]
MRNRTATVVSVLAICLVLVSATVPTLIQGRPANQIPVEKVQGDSLSNPTADNWDEVPQVTVPLSNAPSSVPNANDTSVDEMQVQAARTDAKLYLRLTWKDGTNDSDTLGPRRFADAAAVQFPVNTSERPAISMGSTRNQVNVWYWGANVGTQELFAGGPSTTTSFDNTSVETAKTYQNGSWTLVLERDLRTNQVNRTEFTTRENVDVAFGVWNGSNMERSGRKGVSEWHHLALGPEPSGAPFETILWTIAGLAIVVVALVTVSAVRRT